MSYEYFQAVKQLVKSSEKLTRKKQIKIMHLLLVHLQDTGVRETITVRHNKLRLTMDFYISFVKSALYENAKFSETEMYRFFKYLKNQKYIASNSVHFPINYHKNRLSPLHTFPSKKAFTYFDHVKPFKELIAENILAKSIEDIEVEAFLYLYCFEPNAWTLQHVAEALYENTYKVENYVHTSFLDTRFSERGYTAIETKVISSETSRVLQRFFAYTNRGQIFKMDVKSLIKESEKRITEYFGVNLSRKEIRNILITKSIKDIGPLSTAIEFRIPKTIPIDLLELNKMYKRKVPIHLLQIAKNNLEIMFAPVSTSATKKGDNNNTFDLLSMIKPLFLIEEKGKQINIWGRKSGKIKKVYVELVINNIDKQIMHLKTDVPICILNYIKFLLFKVYPPNKKYVEIVYETVTDYLQKLDKHFFEVFTSWEDIKTSQIKKYYKHLEESNYASKYIQKIKSAINSFLPFIDKSSVHYKINAISMNKSLIFEDELDLILKEIDVAYSKRFKNRSENIEFFKLQDKAFILLLWYTGLRRNELRTRLHSDFGRDLYYVYNPAVTQNCYTLNVNTVGLKEEKEKNEFKSGNANRQVSFTIQNKEHLKIIENFIDQSKTISDKVLFKNRHFTLSDSSTDRKIYKRMLKDRHLDYLNDIIKDVTQRYCSLHSLRRSYVTRTLQYIISNKTFNEAPLNLSVELGHETIISMYLSYFHAELLQYERFQNVA